MAKTLDSLIIELKADISGLQTSLRTAQGQVSRFSAAADAEMRQVEASGKRLGLAIGVAATAVAAATVTMTKALFNAGTQAQALQGKMLAATGSSRTAAESLAFISAESERLGLRFSETANTFASFAAAATRTGLSMEQVRQIFTGVSEAAVAFRLSNENVQGIFMALSQMAAKGVISMEELRQQLGERLPIAMEAAARGLGVSQAELFKLVESGKLAAKDFLPAFGSAIRQNLGDAVVEGSRSGTAAMNRMDNAIDNLKRTAANGEFMAAMAEAIGKVTTAISSPELQKGLSSTATLIGDIATAALDATSKIAGFMQKLNGLLESGGNKVFGALFGQEGIDALDKARKERAGQGAPPPPVAAPPSLPSASTPVKPPVLPDISKKGKDPNAKAKEALKSTQRDLESPIEQIFRERDERLKALREGLEKELLTKQEFQELEIRTNAEFNERLREQREIAQQAELNGWEAFLGDKLKTIQQLNDATFREQGASFRDSISQAAQHNRAFFALEKAAKLAQAILAARESVVHAYNFGSRIGGPYLGAAFAGVAAAAQAVNIASIASADFGGGSTSVSSSGSSSAGTESAGGSSTASGSRGASDKSVFITLKGDTQLFTRDQIRNLIEQINEAVGDGTRLVVSQ